LALNPKIILLDEPLAGLNLEEVEDMARFILDINEEERWQTTCVWLNTTWAWSWIFPIG